LEVGLETAAPWVLLWKRVPVAGEGAILGLRMENLALIPGTIKDELEADPLAVLRQLRELGLSGIENCPNYPAGEAGIPELIAVGVNWDDFDGGYDYLKKDGEWAPERLERTAPKLVERVQAAGVKYAVMYWGPADTVEQVKRLAWMLEEMGKRLRAAGITLCYHNHDHEFQPLPGDAGDPLRAIDILLAETSPDNVAFEVDLGWVRFGGEDPVEFLQCVGSRAPLVHLRDVANLNERGAFALPGLGILDIPKILSAAGQAEWVILEPNKQEILTPMQFVTASILNLRMLA